MNSKNQTNANSTTTNSTTLSAISKKLNIIEDTLQKKKNITSQQGSTGNSVQVPQKKQQKTPQVSTGNSVQVQKQKNTQKTPQQKLVNQKTKNNIEAVNASTTNTALVIDKHHASLTDSIHNQTEALKKKLDDAHKKASEGLTSLANETKNKLNSLKDSTKNKLSDLFKKTTASIKKKVHNTKKSGIFSMFHKTHRDQHETEVQKILKDRETEAQKIKKEHKEKQGEIIESHLKEVDELQKEKKQ